MTEWLLVRLANRPDSRDASWMSVDAAGHLVVPPQTGPLAEAAPLASSRRIALIVPGSEVVSLDAELPARAGARLLQAVPFALEEQLAEDVETLHFALGVRGDNGRTGVNVVSKSLLDAWLAELAAAGLTAAAVFADTALLPDNPGQIVAWLEGEELHIRVPGQIAVSVPSAPLAGSIELAVPQATELSTLGLLLFATPQEWHARSSEFEALRDRFAGFKVQLLPHGPLPLLASGADAGAPINLLQGELAPRNASSGSLRPWRLAAGLAAAAVLLHASAQIWELRSAAAAETALDASISSVVNATFPGETIAADGARSRMEQQLLALRSGGASGGDLLPALAALAQARGAAPDAELESLGFDSGTVDVRIKAKSAESLERINASLRNGGWQAELQGGTASAEAYEGRIRIRAAGAGS
jgi:general secretion pathway protein L